VKPGRPAHLPFPPEGPELDVVQQWFQAVISHPGGVASGVESAEAQRRLPLNPGEIERVVVPSKNLSAEERLGIYAYAYYARLLECLEDGFPVLARALGKEVFQSFALEYLQRYPSRSYTLARLGEDFPRFLEETRPDRDPEAAPGEGGEAPAWPDFLIDLARLELAVVQIFDGPGVEGQPLLRPEDLEALGPERFAAARLDPVPCLRLLDCRYPVNDYYTAARRAASQAEGGEEGAEAEEIPVPDPGPQSLALTRTDFVVRRYPLTAIQRALLGELVEGATVEDAIAVAAERAAGADEALAAEIREAFRQFAAWGFFQGVG
jgi:hypothetical protein